MRTDFNREKFIIGTLGEKQETCELYTQTSSKVRHVEFDDQMENSSLRFECAISDSPIFKEVKDTLYFPSRFQMHSNDL